ncbi:MAG: 4,5-DOPA dioxygenase extradiol [Elusimicrobia bacterium]|nr:4,5-DOPA dioxygenase extradiol [Elusimicrobiota bacterium]
MTLPETEKMPALFVGHGSPMNAIEDNIFSRAWLKAGKALPKPHAVLCISAHWFLRGTFVHGAERPKTLHDFVGFPQALFEQTYPCPGFPSGAEEIRRTVKTTRVGLDAEWGLDHGAWVVLKRLFPKADVPAFQMSIDSTKPPKFHYGLGQELSPLRRRGVLILASGNIVHNLKMMAEEQDAMPFSWAQEFDAIARNSMRRGDHGNVIAYGKLGEAASLAVPSPEHFLPLLYALGLQEEGERPAFFAEGFAYSSISMRSFRLG